MSFAFPEVTAGGIFSTNPVEFLESLVLLYQRVETAYVVDLSAFGVSSTIAPGAGLTHCHVTARMHRVEMEMWISALNHMNVVKGGIGMNRVSPDACTAAWRKG